MARDAEATRRRLLEAATAEFARHGIAGSRVDRIAAAAGCNKAMLYAYFGSKEQLFQTVFDTRVVETREAVKLEDGDLPEFLGRMFDHYLVEPAMLRLAAWDKLERGGIGLTMDEVKTSKAVRLAAIEDAQRRGLATRTFSAAELLALNNALAVLWTMQVPDSEVVDADTVAARRRLLVEAMRLLSAPRPAEPPPGS